MALKTNGKADTDPYAPQMAALAKIRAKLADLGPGDRLLKLHRLPIDWDSTTLGSIEDAIAVAHRRWIPAAPPKKTRELRQKRAEKDLRRMAAFLLQRDDKAASEWARALAKVKGLKTNEVKAAFAKAGGVKKLASADSELEE